MPDLLNIGGSGVLAHQRLLVTTGNNISNVNTPGYSMQRTEYQPEVLGGVGRGKTTRIMSEFAQQAVWRNSSEHVQKKTYLDNLSEVDKVISNDALSLNGKLKQTFDNIHAMNDSPLSTSTRALTLDSFKGLLRRFQLLDGQMANQQKHLNGQLKEKVDTANKLIAGLQKKNVQIMSYHDAPDKGGLDVLKDKRDQDIHALSKILKIHTVDQPNGARLIFMDNGHSLVTEKDHASLDLRDGDPDSIQQEVYLDWNTTEAKMKPGRLGGSLDGMLVYRDKILNPSRNRLGQVALSMTDSFNRQNHLGMDMDGNLGGDIFELPKIQGLDFNLNQGSGDVTAQVIPGQSRNISRYDYLVRFQNNSDFTVQRYDGSQKVGAAVTGSTSDDFKLDGLQFDVSSGGFSGGDKFMLRPTRDAAQHVKLRMTQPEKLALAAPIRVDSDLKNTSNAKIHITGITNTGENSGFTPSGQLKETAPHKIVVNQFGGYDLYDGNGDEITTVPRSDDNRNLLSQSNLDVGFDVSITGKTKPGDVFTIRYNKEGFSDNYNGLKLADLQQKATVRKGESNAQTSDFMTFNSAYSAMVSFVGGHEAEARLDETASKSLLTQSENWHKSISGVNMDEEASNMVRYQQAYAASAQVISVAQKTFESILSALR